MDATRFDGREAAMSRWRRVVLTTLSMLALSSAACSSPAPEAAPSVVPSATPFAALPGATIVAKVPPPTPPPTLTPRPSPTPEAPRVTYQIVAGDNPGSIAAKFDVSTAELLRANNITNASSLQIGQTLVIPATPTPTPVAGTPAATVGTAPAGTAAPAPPPAAARQTYAVKSGDTASGIAGSYAITVAELATLNGTTEAALRNLQIGQQLVVPATPSSTPAPTATPSGTPPPTVSATPTPTAPAAPQAEVYIVKAGDTALDIAAQFGISMLQLAAANNTTPAALGSLQIGQRLTIPPRGVG